MTREFLEHEMNEIRRINSLEFDTFYMTISDQNCKSNRWGKMNKFEDALKYAEESRDYVGGCLPIERLVLINERCIHVWVKNPLWDCVDGDPEDSHVYVNVPLINKNEWFVDPIQWL